MKKRIFHFIFHLPNWIWACIYKRIGVSLYLKKGERKGEPSASMDMYYLLGKIIGTLAGVILSVLVLGILMILFRISRLGAVLDIRVYI